jgi:hypothetical protein
VDEERHLHSRRNFGVCGLGLNALDGEDGGLRREHLDAARDRVIVTQPQLHLVHRERLEGIEDDGGRRRLEERLLERNNGRRVVRVLADVEELDDARAEERERERYLTAQLGEQLARRLLRERTAAAGARGGGGGRASEQTPTARASQMGASIVRRQSQPSQ